MFSLRSPRSIFQKGGTVTPLLEERVFNMKFDNRRQIEGYTISKNINIKNEGLFYLSKPHRDIGSSLLYRKISVLGNARYNVFYPSSSSGTMNGRTYNVLLKRTLVRALLQNQSLMWIRFKCNNSCIYYRILSQIRNKMFTSLCIKTERSLFLTKCHTERISYSIWFDKNRLSFIGCNNLF